MSDNWIDINEQQPIAGQEVLFCSINEIFVAPTFGLYLGDKFSSHRFLRYDNKSFNATHWQILPVPPRKAYEKIMMTGISESMKIKMLNDIGMHNIPLAEGYLKLLDFVRTISNEGLSILDREFYCHHAKILLKQIGEE